jgi:hypothetical protein
VEDFDLLPMLSPKEFRAFLAFFRSAGSSTHFFFGDFSSAVARLPNLMRDFDMALNIRDFNARAVKIDETGIIASAFESRGLCFTEDARGVMDDAWARFRGMRLNERLDEAMENFIAKSEFSSSVENGTRVLNAACFAWAGGKPSASLSAADRFR